RRGGGRGRGDREWGGGGGSAGGRGILVKSWSGGGRWRQWERARFSTRIDAVIAHEWLEFGGLTHLEAAAAGPMTPLPISRGARRPPATPPDIQRETERPVNGRNPHARGSQGSFTHRRRGRRTDGDGHCAGESAGVHAPAD